MDIVYEGEKYPSAEHAFQAAKCVNSVDKEKIRKTKSAAVAKRIGRRVQLRTDWEQQKLIIMENILEVKFEHKNMRELLNKTKGRGLEEQNKWHDTYWGVCICNKHKPTGKNMLGTLLMKIRNME